MVARILNSIENKSLGFFAPQPRVSMLVITLCVCIVCGVHTSIHVCVLVHVSVCLLLLYNYDIITAGQHNKT